MVLEVKNGGFGFADTTIDPRCQKCCVTGAGVFLLFQGVLVAFVLFESFGNC